MSKLPLPAQLEAVLFMCAEPVSAKTLAGWCKADVALVEQALAELAATLQARGIRLTQHDSAYQLATAPEAAGVIATITEGSASEAELTPAALETLAIIAYEGPVSVRRVSELRGVASDIMVRNLQARGLAEPTPSRTTDPTNQPVYQISHQCLHQFGLSSRADLPAVGANHEN